MKYERERRRRTKDLPSPPNKRAVYCGEGEQKRTESSDRGRQSLVSRKQERGEKKEMGWEIYCMVQI